MTLTLQAWHTRFQEQARWTQTLRIYTYQQVKIEQAKRILEVGCGSGAILGELSQYTKAKIFGLDIDISFINMAMRNTQNTTLFQADAHHIPISSSFFDLSLCHFVLLWVNNPINTLQEMVRVTRPGGYVCALAEPDYGGRIDYPSDFRCLGESQTQALRAQGANPMIGRQLRSLMNRVGLAEVICGVLGGNWAHPPNENEWLSEWEVLEADLVGDPDFQASRQELKAQDKLAWDIGERILFIPTFYAWGKVPD